MPIRLPLWGTLQAWLALVLLFHILPRRSGFPVLAHALRAHVKGVGLGDPPPRDVLLGTLWSGVVALDNLLYVFISHDTKNLQLGLSYTAGSFWQLERARHVSPHTRPSPSKTPSLTWCRSTQEDSWQGSRAAGGVGGNIKKYR